MKISLRLCYSALETKQMRKSPLSNSNFKLQLISLLFALFAANIYAATITGIVPRVSDGDTIQVSGVRCQESEIEESKNRKIEKCKYKVRLAKIDAPEKSQEWGKEAAEKLRELIGTNIVNIVWEKCDRYKRIIGVIYLGEIDINLAMVASGNAWHYKAFDKTPEYANAEAAARENHLGLWSRPSPINPAIWRRGLR